MTDRVEVEAQFPGSTAAEAYAKALEMLETPGALGFTPTWSTIKLETVYSGEEEEPTWIATLKARRG